MKPTLRALALIACLLSSLAVWGDEGMWLFNAFPREKLASQYGFAASQQWLDHVRLGSVRFNNGGSGSFVSPDGLTFTNHHVGSECIHDLSSGGKDYVRNGFYAKTQAEEAKCPNLELNQLVAIEDVTSLVKKAAASGMSAAEAGQAQRAEMSNIEKECATRTALRCDVITLYSGEVYNLYKYKKYTDVRLVFAPEFGIAFFGGDPDNFTYPRYDLDISFFRVYENNKPAHTDPYLHWSSEGVENGDLIFVSGNPGSTDRLKTMSQLAYLRDVDYPSRLNTYQRRIGALTKFSSESAENARMAEEYIFSLENSFKAVTGYESGLRDRGIMAKKVADEDTLHSAWKVANANAGDPWQEISAAVKVESDIYKPFTYLERLRGFSPAKLPQFARLLVRVTQEKTIGNEKRLREYRDSNLPSLEQQLFSTAPIYKSLEIASLSDSLEQMREELGRENPDVERALAGRSPQEAANYLVETSTLDQVRFRKQLYEGGVAAVEASKDPLIILMRAIDPDARAVRKTYDDKVDAIERQDGAAIARARFEKSGFTEPPDATFTLRLSYGAVKGYEETTNSSDVLAQVGQHRATFIPPQGLKVDIPYFTTMAGAFEHAAAHSDKPPYELPESWMRAKSSLNLDTPLNFVSTADIIGGNSGSPTVNKAAEVVGIIFDGNIQSLVLNFAYTDVQARAVHVDSRAIIEALRKIYGANPLADELTQTSAAAKASKMKSTEKVTPPTQP
ncbi:MAG: S46 family peptidase [Acidobacteria bacterium]|nr:S46 family peptidase [Acidobacteriota bacterium]